MTDTAVHCPRCGAPAVTISALAWHRCDKGMTDEQALDQVQFYIGQYGPQVVAQVVNVMAECRGGIPIDVAVQHPTGDVPSPGSGQPGDAATGQG